MELRVFLAYALIAVILGIAAVWAVVLWRNWRREQRIRRNYWRKPRE